MGFVINVYIIIFNIYFYTLILLNIIYLLIRFLSYDRDNTWNNTFFICII